MSADTNPQDGKAPKKKGMLVPLILGVFLAAVGGGAGFWAVTAGPLANLGAPSDEIADEASESDEEQGDTPRAVAVAFVPLDTVTISLGGESVHRHLIFSAELEVEPSHVSEVEMLKPRILDVLNSYLRIVGVDELSEPASLLRIRSQMLHRIQIVAGEGRVRDLLITQFVVN